VPNQYLFQCGNGGMQTRKTVFFTRYQKCWVAASPQRRPKKADNQHVLNQFPCMCLSLDAELNHTADLAHSMCQWAAMTIVLRVSPTSTSTPNYSKQYVASALAQASLYYLSCVEDSTAHSIQYHGWPMGSLTSAASSTSAPSANVHAA